MTDSKKKPTCKYGSTCYRKNPDHLRDFYHPPAEGNEDEDIKPQKKSPETEPATKKRKTIDEFFGGGKKKPDEMPSSTKGADGDGKAAGNTSGYVRQGNTSGYSRTKSKDDSPEKSKALSEDEDDGPESPSDVRENIKSKFLVEMPEDFYDFWEFAKTVKSSKPQDAFQSLLNLQLVGPYDVLAGKCVKRNSKGKRPCYLRHWRYYYDPPEFLTVLRGDDSTQFHMGYFRDDPKEFPVFVASNAAKDSCTISPRGENIFAAVSWYIDCCIKKDKDKKSALSSLKSDLVDWAKKKEYSLESKTKAMKARDKKVVCKAFHGAGIVVPVDENEIGYREVPETPADLKKMFKKIAESKDDEEKAKNFDPLMELITLVQFANDECDYGEGLELGMDIFCYGHKVFTNTIRNLLPLAYELLHRPEFKKIIEAHLDDRKHTVNLSQLD